MTDKKFTKLKRGFVSLRMRFVAIFLIASLLAIGCYFLAKISSNGYINNVYLSDENKAKRESEYHRGLQEYISENGITFESIDRVSEWAKQNQYVYLLIYKEQTDDEAYFIPDDMVDKLPQKPAPTPNPNPDETPDDTPTEGDGETGKNPDSSDTGVGEGGENGDTGAEDGDDSSTDKDDDDKPIGGITLEWPTRSELEAEAKKRDMLVIELPENQYVYAKFAEYTEYLYYDIANLGSLALGALVVLIIFLIYITNLTRRISRLGAAVNTVAAGDTDRQITVSGEDEISELAANVETMRSSIVENYKKEKEALDSNTQLITSMSHDIRTPLTVLLGYMDVMRAHAEGDEQMQGYIKAAETTAMRLKKLSDDMFGYFLVFGRDERTLELEEYDALTLFDQMLAEHILLLKENGYSAEVDISSETLTDKNVIVDTQSLIRMVDNMFSNLYKYADKSAPVRISVDVDSANLLLCFENAIRQDGERVESNGIGLKTCRKLAEHMNATFDYSIDGNRFYANISLPYVLKKEKNDG